MARFFSYEEIERGLTTTREMVGRLARRIMEIREFQMGRAVVFGSVAWGEHTWRSDVDVADFSNSEGDSRVPFKISELFREIYGDKGEKDNGSRVENHLVEIMGAEQKRECHYNLPKISPSTRDHFKLLSKVRGGVWSIFFKNLRMVPLPSRLRDIRNYLAKIEWHWLRLYRDMLGHHWISWDDFKALQSLENFPKQLMRKILGEKNQLPCPDTFCCIQEAFQKLEYEWAQELCNLFPPFYEIDKKYKTLIEGMSQQRIWYNPKDYGQQVCQMFVNLPVKKICEIVRQAYDR